MASVIANQVCDKNSVPHKPLERTVRNVLLATALGGLLTGLLALRFWQHDGPCLYVVLLDGVVFTTLLALLTALFSRRALRVEAELFRHSAQLHLLNLTLQREVVERAKAEQQLHQKKAFLQTMTDASPFALYVVDNRTDTVLYFNRRFIELWGLQNVQSDLLAGNLKNSDLIPGCLTKVTDPEGFAKTCKPLQTMDNRTVVEDEIPLRDQRVIRRFSLQIRDEHDNYFGRLYLFEDITQRKAADQRLNASLKEKEILLREVYHRVKNNLQVISSLLNLQSAAIQDHPTLRLIRETQDRVRSMALVHEKLYRANDLSHIDFSDYARQLVLMLSSSYRVDEAPVQVRFEMESIPLNLDTAIPCGLILNELVSNAFKYAFPATWTGRNREIIVGFSRAATGTCFLSVEDTGIGLPEQLNVHATSTLGLQVVCLLTDQLQGSLLVQRDHGTRFMIEFRELADRAAKAAGLSLRPSLTTVQPAA